MFSLDIKIGLNSLSQRNYLHEPSKKKREKGKPQKILHQMSSCFCRLACMIVFTYSTVGDIRLVAVFQGY